MDKSRIAATGIDLQRNRHTLQEDLAVMKIANVFLLFSEIEGADKNRAADGSDRVSRQCTSALNSS